MSSSKEVFPAPDGPKIAVRAEAIEVSTSSANSDNWQQDIPQLELHRVSLFLSSHSPAKTATNAITMQTTNNR